MGYIDKLVEPRIQQAIGRGEFHNLPGTGKRLGLDDDTLVPPELRVAYRFLNHVGYLPRISNCNRKSPILKPLSPLSTIRHHAGVPISDSTICVHNYKPLAVIRPTLGLSGLLSAVA